MSKEFENFKKALKDDSFKEKFLDVKNLNEALKVAKLSGYNLSKKEVQGDKKLTDDLMDSIAGGNKSEYGEAIQIDTMGKRNKVWVGDDE